MSFEDVPEHLELIGAEPDEHGVILHLETGEFVHLCWCRLALLAEDYGGRTCPEPATDERLSPTPRPW